jgi:hypothetical protein
MRYAITSGESNMNQKVPFLDLVTPHLGMEDEFIAVFRDALKTGQFIGGPMVEAFEREFAEFCGTKYAIGVGSGTDALRFVLIAAGIKQGTSSLPSIPSSPRPKPLRAERTRNSSTSTKTYNMDPESSSISLAGM